MKKRRIQTILIASLLILNTACSAQSVSPTESEDGREASSSSQTSENSSSVSSKPENIHTITVDFSKRAGAPLVKKFGFFNSGLVSLERTEHTGHRQPFCRISPSGAWHGPFRYDFP